MTSANATKEIIDELDNIDWNFDLLSSTGDLTSLHPYPARFIPAIPGTIINIIKKYKEELTVLDPFAGCGTVLNEGIKSGCDVVGIDINGLANLLQRAYTSSVDPSDIFKLNLLKTRVIDSITSANQDNGIELNIPNLNHWFDFDSIGLIKSSMDTVLKEKDSEIRTIGLLCISRVLVLLSRQKSETQYVAIEKNLTRNYKIKLISDSFDTVIKYFSERKKIINRTLCLHGDSREKSTYINIPPIDLVITSPPYPNAFEYWLYHKYRMYWMGMDPIWSRNSEIGARPYYSGSGKKDEWDFYEDIKKVLIQINDVTTKNALQFWVVGDSIIKGRSIDNSKIVIDAANEVGWKNIATYKRKINRRKSSFQGIGNKEFEKILVFSR